MHYKLIPATTELLDEAYEMYQEFPPNENGFVNNAHQMTLGEFELYVKGLEAYAHGQQLPEGYVPMSTFWLQVNGQLVGISKLRHHLTEALKVEGGHIGYGIRPAQRNKRYATKLLELTLDEARKLGLQRVLITVNQNNIPSQKVVTNNGGVLDHITETKHYYWIEIS